MRVDKAVDLRRDLKQRFIDRRQQSLVLIQGLDAEDMVVQSMPDASPTKWHLAHTTWFFEQFVLTPYAPNYCEFHPRFNYLFNSYYNNVGERHARPLRGLLTRPTLAQILEYRQVINEAVCELIDRLHAFEHGLSEEITAAIISTIEVGLHHEMQHQELMLTDILHALSFNSLYPAIQKNTISQSNTQAVPMTFEQVDEGLYSIGAVGRGFSFDCEYPRHQSYLPAFALANRPVTNQEWLAFIDDGGYQTSTLWLSDGWDECQRQQWQAPLYWSQEDGEWFQFSHYGRHNLDLHAPVCHISYYEADAYATWANARLPTEQEWEVVATQHPIKGNFQESGQWLPQATQPQVNQHSGMQQLYGDVWEWTRSAYSPYPGYRAPQGAIGEYNGKFMSNQFVLRGGSCVTPREQLRPSYRNFFYPHQRWQFTGLRLAKDM